ncbi:hypothetical protein AB0A95_33435 [Micromonospora sp. NPDC049230]|uniref:hypothetical protein n=1 Tax=Micromonospora sp. NPDC049230 TaxID=3155502 RepID=UPI0033FA54C2
MSDDSEYATTVVTYPEHSAPEVVETVQIEGKPVQIVRYATLTERPSTIDGEPVFGRATEFAAIPAGTKLRPLSIAAYKNNGKYHKAGDVTIGQAIAGPTDWGTEYARCATVKAAIKGARDRVERDRLYAQYSPIAAKHIASHTREQFETLDANAAIEPGDLVVVYSHKRFRTGVATKVTPTRVECLAGTPTGGVNGATRKKGDEVRLLRKTTPTAPVTPAVEEGTPVAEDVATDRARTADHFADGIGAAASQASTDPRTPRGRWAVGLPPATTPEIEQGLVDAAADFRAERDERAAAAAREVEQMRSELLHADVQVSGLRGLSDDQVRAVYASRTTNRVTDVGGRTFGPGALVECVGPATAVLTGWRGHAVAVGNYAEGDGQWVELDFVGREGGQVRSADRVRVINDYDDQGAPVPADAPAQGEALAEPTPAAAVPAAADGSAGYLLAEPTSDALRLLAQVAAAPAGTTAVFDGAGDVAYVQADDEGGPGNGEAPLELDEVEQRRADVGRMFAEGQGMPDAVAGCTLYRMVRARVGARLLQIHDAGGKLLGTVEEVRVPFQAAGWRAQLEDGAVLPARPGGLFASFADGVAAVRTAASNQDDDQDAAAAAQGEGEPMTTRKPTPAEASALRRAAAGNMRGYIDGPMDVRNRIRDAGWSDSTTGVINDAGLKVAAENPYRPSSKALAALRAAAADPRGWFPDECHPRLIGDLIREGMARRAYPTEIPEIAPLGHELLTQIDGHGGAQAVDLQSVAEMTPVDERRLPTYELAYEDHLLAEGAGTPRQDAAAELYRLILQGRSAALVIKQEMPLRQYATLEEMEAALTRPGAADTLRAIADHVERDQAGHVTEIEVDGAGQFQWRCVQGDAEGSGYDIGEEAYQAAVGHGPMVASSRFTRTPTIEHSGRGNNEHGVPRRSLAGSLEWEPYDGGEWRLVGRGSTSEIPEHDVAGAHAWAAGLLGEDDYDRRAVRVVRWEHHCDVDGEWWEPVTG